MKIATILFTYNRSRHTKQVLDALASNNVLPEKLFIFQDGIKQGLKKDEWMMVKEIIHNVDFCPVEIIESETNKGLARSIVDGVDFALQFYDAVIVLEDDCVPAPSFMKFMYQSLEKYEMCNQVYCVSGYAWNIALKPDEYDAYFNGRISSWGWGTWRSRWQQYVQDNQIIKRLSGNIDGSRKLASWGKDLPTMLAGRMNGKNDSWAVYWALGVIEKGGLCLCPYKSLISNVGFDGTGTHCGVGENHINDLNTEVIEHFNLPESLEIQSRVCKAFSSLFGSKLCMSSVKDVKDNVVIYGLGNFFHQYENDLNDDFNVVALCDKSKKGFYAGYEIIGPSDIGRYEECKVVIMLMDVQAALETARRINKEYNVLPENILFGLALYKNPVFNGESITYDKCDERGSLRFNFKGIECSVGSVDEFYNAREVLEEENYHYYINNCKKDVVLDIGMNIGSASLFFLQDEKVSKIYSFEPFLDTFESAKRNLEYTNQVGHRIELYNYGISNVDEYRTIQFNPDMTCGQSTIQEISSFANQKYEKDGYINANNTTMVQIKVKKASDVLREIVDKWPEKNIIIKMDCEGEEYVIIDDLYEADLLSRVNMIMMEWHYKGKDTLLAVFRKAGFSYWCMDKSKEMGLIYAVKI